MGKIWLGGYHWAKNDKEWVWNGNSYFLTDPTDIRLGLRANTTMDKFEMMMADIKKLDVANSLDFGITHQFIERQEKNGEINSDKKLRLKDEIKTKNGNPKVRESIEKWGQECTVLELLILMYKLK